MYAMSREDPVCSRDVLSKREFLLVNHLSIYNPNSHATSGTGMTFTLVCFTIVDKRRALKVRNSAEQTMQQRIFQANPLNNPFVVIFISTGALIVTVTFFITGEINLFSKVLHLPAVPKLID